MNDIDCGAFEQWLDAGADPALATVMHAHTAGCPACAAALAAMSDIDAWLAAPIPAPSEFTETIMARIAHTPALRAVPVADDMPWWLAILQHPAVVLATIVSALLLWKANALVAAVAVAAAWLSEMSLAAASWATAWNPAFGAGSPLASETSAWVATGLALGLAPLLAYGSIALAGWVTGRIAPGGPVLTRN